MSSILEALYPEVIAVQGINTIPYNITLQPDSTDGQDSFVRLGTPDTNWGNTITLAIVGSPPTGNHSYVKFTGLSAIPSGATIVSAILSLFEASSPVDGAVTLKRVLSGWDEDTITWNNKPSTGEVVATGVFPLVIGGEATFDLTAAVQSWVNGAWGNYGFTVEKYIYASGLTAYSSNYVTDITKRPKLVIQIQENIVTGAGRVPHNMSYKEIYDNQTANVNTNLSRQIKGLFTGSSGLLLHQFHPLDYDVVNNLLAE